jgi:hypothetical protein
MSVARAELTKRKPRPKKSSEAFHFLDREAKLSEDEFHDGVSSDESGSSEPAAYDASFVDDCTQRVNNEILMTTILYSFAAIYDNSLGGNQWWEFAKLLTQSCKIFPNF